MPADLEVLEALIGHKFHNKDLLVRSLTHKSLSFEKKLAQDVSFIDNEQLEFMGDAILGFLVSECLVRRFPSYPEGRLSKIKAHLVSAARLHEVAQDLDLGVFLHMGRGEEMSGGRAKKALLANALEAVIAALYLDGGIDPARNLVVDRIIGPNDPERLNVHDPVTDYKSALQERAQALKLPQPRYSIVKETGPEHAKTFIVEVRVGTWSSRGEGTSKKAAGQNGAKAVLDQLK
ncbi:MAG TPA: ribonuclease III [Bryobacteraceae bacterium]|nr:ribonuclease III [Bryobacteraceae bacterium]